MSEEIIFGMKENELEWVWVWKWFGFGNEVSWIRSNKNKVLKNKCKMQIK
jgi:hypothetical protein